MKPIAAGFLAALAVSLLEASSAPAPPALDGIYLPTASAQTEADEYTLYELLAPESASFRISYEVTATTAGAKFFYNPIRKGSAASDESVLDAMSGAALHFEVVAGTEARKDPLMPDADPDTRYIKVTLARPVPEHGGARLLVLKTYRDEKSYYREGAAIVFNRPLGIPRNKVVLPPGYAVAGLNVPSQILSQPDGRVAISFMHAGAGEAPLVLRAVKGAQTGNAAVPRALSTQRSWEAPFAGETEQDRLSERAHQDREIVYFLQAPETHSFILYHDYTETRPGVNGYANVVREGSVASHPSARILDTGEELQAREMSGAELITSKIDAGEDVAPTARVVVIPFPAVKAGQTLRLRITAHGLDYCL